MAFTFDATNKMIILSTGTVSIDLADLWSDWKDWLLLGHAGAAHPVTARSARPATLA